VDAEFMSNSSDPVLRKRDRIRLVPNSGERNDEALIRQIGQRVVDNLGNAYTVVGNDGEYIKVDPPVPATVLDTDPDPMLVSIRQLVFTPQIPVSVFIVEVEP
jgi:hypothetical protein